MATNIQTSVNSISDDTIIASYLFNVLGYEAMTVIGMYGSNILGSFQDIQWSLLKGNPLKMDTSVLRTLCYSPVNKFTPEIKTPLYTGDFTRYFAGIM